MTTEEVQRIAQQILDRRGYLVISVAETFHPGDKLDGIIVPERGDIPLGAELRVLQETDFADNAEQCRLAQEIHGCPVDPEWAPRYYRAIAE